MKIKVTRTVSFNGKRITTSVEASRLRFCNPPASVLTNYGKALRAALSDGIETTAPKRKKP